MNDDAPSTIRALLSHHGIALKKRWGQNFMIDPAARGRVVAAIDPADTDTVWEIGPGLGAITELLSQAAARLIVFEIDWGLIDRLRERFGDRVTIVPGDAVKSIGEHCSSREGFPDAVCGNLPYASGAAIVSTLLECEPIVACTRTMVFTVQLESAERMTAAPRTKAYSAFSVLVQLSARSELLFRLPPGAFYPAPAVRSAVVRMTPAPHPHRRTATIVARAFFQSRRKTIRNTIAAAAREVGRSVAEVEAAVAGAGFDTGLRPEEIPPAGYAAIAAVLDA